MDRGRVEAIVVVKGYLFAKNICSNWGILKILIKWKYFSSDDLLKHTCLWGKKKKIHPFFFFKFFFSNWSQFQLLLATTTVSNIISNFSTGSHLSTLTELRIIYAALLEVTYFPPYNPFFTNATLLAYCKFDGKCLDLQSFVSPVQTFTAQSHFDMSTVLKPSFIMHYFDKSVPLQKFQETLICGTNSRVDTS